MKKNNKLSQAGIGAAAAVLMGLSGASVAGGYLDTFNFTGQPAFEGFNTVELTPIFWDKRCANVEYTLDTILPNEGTDIEIDLESTRTALQSALNSWNVITTSFINMNITKVETLGNGNRGFDFINELTFETPETFTALASSPSTSLQADTQFNVGDDIDGDGDSDVYDPDVEGVNVCTDIDNDGDIEFPAGFYLAGTILDNDVQFNNRTVAWSLEASDETTADIEAIAVHEFGHSHGLSHASINVISGADGTGSTMFPFIDTGDAAAELATRTLHEDDISWSSYAYQEGTDDTGIAALQEDDEAFDEVYALLKGNITKPDGLPIAGASLQAVELGRLDTVQVEALSGSVRFVERIADGALFFANEEFAVADGDFEIPVKQGRYRILAQALDGSPVAASRVSSTASFGNRYSPDTFPEEYLSRGRQEGSIEVDPGRGQMVNARPGNDVEGLNVVINNERVLSSYDAVEFGGTSAVFGATDVVYATRFANADVLDLLATGASITSASILTNVFDESVVPRFKRVALATGKVDENGVAQINTQRPIRQQLDFIAQDADDTPFFFRGARSVGRVYQALLRRDPELDLFVIVEVDDNFETGPGGLPPLVAVDTNSEFGDSFLSLNGEGFAPINLNFAIQLRFTGE
jgi:hypothetical protein